MLSKIEKNILDLRFRVIGKVKTDLDNILKQVSIEEKAVIICNAINEMSLDLIYNGASPKPHYISAQTQKSGVLGGFILKSEGCDDLSKKTIFIKSRQDYYFYNSNNTIVPTKIFKNDIAYIKGLVDENNRFLTSDLDILAIATSSSVDYTPLSQSYAMGNILKYEYDIASKINSLFNQHILNKKSSIEKKTTGIVKHGPFNRYPKTKLEDIYYPIAIYHPKKGKFFIGSEHNRDKSFVEFLNLLEKLQNDNYYVNVHSNWVI